MNTSFVPTRKDAAPKLDARLAVLVGVLFLLGKTLLQNYLEVDLVAVGVLFLLGKTLLQNR